jgi:two-component system response regulator NreC
MKTKEKIRVLIADDHNLVRAGIAALLSNYADIHVVGEAANGKEAIEKVKALLPDIVLMDISMPVMDGIKAAQEIIETSQPTKVLMLTQYDQQEYVKRVMHSGVSGYILKSSLSDDLIKAIRMVRGGKRFVTPGVSETMVNAYFTSTKGSATQKNPKRLTNRESEILALVAEGLANQQIANKLFISVRTVEFHRTNIMEKLGIHDTPNLVRYAILNKLIELDQ